MGGHSCLQSMVGGHGADGSFHVRRLALLLISECGGDDVTRVSGMAVAEHPFRLAATQGYMLYPYIRIQEVGHLSLVM